MQFLRRFRRLRRSEEASSSSKGLFIDLGPDMKSSSKTAGESEKPKQKARASSTEDDHLAMVGPSLSEIQMLRSRGYDLYEKIGEGSYSKIFRASYFNEKVDNRGPTKLACKVIDEMYSSDDFVDKFFQRSAEIMSLVSHAHLIKLHSIMTRRQKYFVFMEYASHGDLLEFIEKSGPIKELQSRVWFNQILSGVHCLHDADIAHRDLKCENILLDRNYQIKITDYDFARWTVDEHGKPELSQTFCGSPSYAAPEVINGTPYDPKISDIWSLGVILFVMLNKSMPFDDQNLRELYDAQINRRWSIRNSLKYLISLEAECLIRIILDPNPQSRPSLETIKGDKWLMRPKVPGSRSPSRSRHASGGEKHAPYHKISRSTASVGFSSSSITKVSTEDTILALSAGLGGPSVRSDHELPGETGTARAYETTRENIGGLISQQEAQARVGDENVDDGHDYSVESNE